MCVGVMVTDSNTYTTCGVPCLAEMCSTLKCVSMYVYIRESVDSLCRDGTDMPIA